MSSLLIGLTGGIGSGKTTIAGIFADLGIDVIDADVVSRTILNSDRNVLSLLKSRWGSEIMLSDGSLNRRLLREKIFNSAEEKSFLEGILHPLIRTEVKRQALEAASPYALVVVPLMFETHFDELVDYVVCVDLEVEKQVERTCARDRISPELARKIIASQMDRQRRISLSDYVIYNYEQIELKKQKVRELHNIFLGLADHE